VKLLLDEMWPSEIAAQLRRHGHDVVTVTERLELRGQPDDVVLAIVCAEGRAVVTENAIDYRPLAAQIIQETWSHSGLILTTNRRFPRHEARTLGRLVRALTELLSRRLDSTNVELWLS